METLVVILSIFACGDGGESCRQIERRATDWPTVAACESHLDAVLSKHTHLDAPRIVAACEPSQPEALVASLRAPERNDATN